MRSFSVAFVAFCLAFNVNAYANEAFYEAEVVDSVISQCCIKSSVQKRNTCISQQYSKIRGLKKILGKNFLKNLKVDLNSLKKVSACEDFVTANASEEVKISTVEKNIKSLCCADEFKLERKSCLKQASKTIKKAKKILGNSGVNAVLSDLAKKMTSKQCGAGGKNYTAGCQVMRSLGGGFLHKYPSDHGNVVLLLPSYDSASSCEYVSKKGETLVNLHYVYRANGNRQHFRPYSNSAGRCGDFKGEKPVYARCTIKGKKNCWEISNPCTRCE